MTAADWNASFARAVTVELGGAATDDESSDTSFLGMIREMTKRSDQLIATCAHDATFSLMYLRVTESLREHIATDPMLFEHPDFIRHQDHLFAQMYWRAHDLFASGQSSGLPGAWLVALDAAGDRSMPALGDMYLGANAHILADLRVLLYQLGLADENGDSRKPDHDAVNRVLQLRHAGADAVVADLQELLHAV
jgi:hypothetical protein